MSIKTNILALILVLLLAVSIGASYYKYVVLGDYTIEAEAPCNPETEICFARECDDSSGECSDEFVNDTEYYKYVYRTARNVPACDSDEPGCSPFTCTAGEAECETVFCSAEILDEWEIEGECTNPDDYTNVSADTNI